MRAINKTLAEISQLQPGPIDQFPVVGGGGGYVKIFVDKNEYYWMPELKFEKYVQAVELQNGWFIETDDNGKTTIYSGEIKRTKLEEAIIKTAYNTVVTSKPRINKHNEIGVSLGTNIFKLVDRYWLKCSEHGLKCLCKTKCRITGSVNKELRVDV